MQTNQESREANNQILVLKEKLANSRELPEVNWFKSRRENLLEMYDLLPKTWLLKIYFYELLLIIGELDGDPRYGITDYFEMLQTRNCTTKTLSTFLNGRIADGDLIPVPSLKQSRRTYKLKSELKEICESLTIVPSYVPNR